MTAERFLSGVDWLDGHPMMEAVVTPAGGPVPAGLPADAIDEFHELDSELMKRGTLQQGDIRWPWVSEEATRLMRISKDVRILSAMLHAAQQQGERPVFPLALTLAARFFTLWSQSVHPEGRMRQRLCAHIGDQLNDLFPKDGTLFEEAGLFDACLKAVELGAGLDAEAFPELSGFFKNARERVHALKEDAVGPPPAREKAGALPAPVRAKPANIASAPKTSDLNLDTANERALKQSLVAVADFLQQIDPDHPLPYSLRRYATWYGVVSAPPIKNGQRTVLQAVSEETVDRYRSAVERSQADAEIVTKLERSCHLQPFWIEGQYLAARLALAAGRETVAEAIREETLRFTRSISGLGELCFSEGAPFIPKDVALWLETRPEPEPEAEPEVAIEPEAAKEQKPAADGGFVAVDRQFQSTIRNVRAAAKKGEYSEALTLLDAARENAEGLRAASLWEIVAMESLSEWGLKANVSSQARRLYNTIESTPLSEWEPEFLRRLMRLI